jgi:hypothetical protein
MLISKRCVSQAHLELQSWFSMAEQNAITIAPKKPPEEETPLFGPANKH